MSESKMGVELGSKCRKNPIRIQHFLQRAGGGVLVNSEALNDIWFLEAYGASSTSEALVDPNRSLALVMTGIPVQDWGKVEETMWHSSMNSVYKIDQCQCIEKCGQTINLWTIFFNIKKNGSLISHQFHEAIKTTKGSAVPTAWVVHTSAAEEMRQRRSLSSSHAWAPTSWDPLDAQRGLNICCCRYCWYMGVMIMIVTIWVMLSLL